jgi:ribosome-binding factor A
VVLVVAADDGVMPQTVEAINHAKAGGVPLIVAINKMDKPDADPQRVRMDLLQHEVIVESVSGETLEVPVSALKQTGLDKLLEAIHLQAELLDLKANPKRSAEGVVIEAKLERGRGPVGTALVQRGTLRVGDIVVAGSAWGRVRALIDDRGETVSSGWTLGPRRDPGFDSAPEAGDPFAVVENEGRAREITDYRVRKRRQTLGSAGTARTLEQMMQQLKEAGRKEFELLVKGDVQGSVEAIAGALRKIGNDEVEARIVHSGVGGITESDIALANASKAVVIGFNVRANAQAKALADQSGVEIRYYNIIYDLVDDVKAAMSGLLAPTLREIFLGNAQILEVFNISKIGKVAGCRVTDGKVERGAKVRPDPRQRGDPRGHAVDAQALQGRGARGAGRAGVRHGLRQLPGHPGRATSSSASTSRPSRGHCDLVSDPSGLTPFLLGLRRSVSDPEGSDTTMANRRSEKSTGPSQRQLRVGELIRHALAEMLTRSEIHDDVLAAHVVTIPEVRMSPDLRLATIYVTTLGGEDLAPVLAARTENASTSAARLRTSSISSSRPTCASGPMRLPTRHVRIDEILRSPRWRRTSRRPELRPQTR